MTGFFVNFFLLAKCVTVTFWMHTLLRVKRLVLHRAAVLVKKSPELLPEVKQLRLPFDLHGQTHGCTL